MISVYTEGVGEVVVHLDKLDARMTEELRKSISQLTFKLASRIANGKLSGQSLNVGRTGALKRSVENGYLIKVSSDKVTGIVTTGLFYGIGWETGWPNGGPGSQHQSLASAKAKFDLSATADTFKNGRPKKRAFLVPGLKEYYETGEITQEIEAAVSRATQA